MIHNRGLAVIMFTDLVGYTKVMGEDEERAFRLLDQSRKIKQPLVKSYGGKRIKELGDGAIIIFDSVLNAVQCGLEMQESIQGFQALPPTTSGCRERHLRLDRSVRKGNPTVFLWAERGFGIIEAHEQANQ